MATFNVCGLQSATKQHSVKAHSLPNHLRQPLERTLQEDSLSPILSVCYLEAALRDVSEPTSHQDHQQMST